MYVESCEQCERPVKKTSRSRRSRTRPRPRPRPGSDGGVSTNVGWFSECNSSKNNDGKSNDESNKVANFTVAINNDSTESTYFVDRLRRQQQHQQQQQQQYQLQQYLQRTSRCGIQTLSSHIPSNAAKDIVEDELRNDLVYVHCATTEDEDIDEDDEEEEPTGLARSRSWLCCPGDRRSERTVPVHVEMDYTDKQHSVSSKFPNQNQQPTRI
ncbi:hypothetical protein HZH68_006636 [Vespula germanica]|uniref:Uncharacterized protein n=1 Tax=Vespula germanica TaxID=30212 RepID=A0A834KDB1_VESGE|nr:hypothetical protein HZH68_006636 [Vespula germanica]